MTNKNAHPSWAIEFGWGAPTIQEQFPNMNAVDAAHFQRDHEDLSRLKIRGLITYSQHKEAIARLAKKIWRAAQ